MDCEKHDWLPHPQLQSLWVQQLAADFEYFNRVHLANALQPPVFRLVSSKVFLGRWDAEKRSIEIALQHIGASPWLEVLETLKHEMAHQFVSEVLRSVEEAPHGEIWQSVGKRLGYMPAGVDAPATPHASDKVLRQVRKLLALADANPSACEVEAALAMAQRKMLQYNIAIQSVTDNPEGVVVRWLGEPQTRVGRHLYRLSSILQSYFFVQVVWTSTYLAKKHRAASQLEVIGLQANVEMADYLYATLQSQMHSAWQAYRQQNHLVRGVRAKNAYFDGLLSGLENRLAQVQQGAEEEGLIWRGDAQASAVFGARHPRTSPTRMQSVCGGAMHSAGEDDSRGLRLSRPLHESSQKRRGNSYLSGYVSDG